MPTALHTKYVGMRVEKTFNGCEYGGMVNSVMWHPELDTFMYRVEYDDNEIEELGVVDLAAILLREQPVPLPISPPHPCRSQEGQYNDDREAEEKKVEDAATQRMAKVRLKASKVLAKAIENRSKGLKI